MPGWGLIIEWAEIARSEGDSKMYTYNERDEKVFEDLKACFRESGLPIKAEKRFDAFMLIESEFNYPAYPVKITVLLDAPHDTVTMNLYYGTVPKEKMPVLYELVDRINMVLYSSHFVIHPETGQLALLSAMYFTDDKINKTEFHMILYSFLYTIVTLSNVRFVRETL